MPSPQRRSASTRTPQRRQPQTASRRRPSSPVRPTLFHAPSFSAGVVLGAIVVLGAAYLPELLGRRGAPLASAPAAPAGTAPSRELTFEFDDLLRNSRVAADPEPYASEPASASTAPEHILLQAASFRARDDAERLRARLLLLHMPAATEAISLASGDWYRVTVGPFDSSVQAQRVLTQLREMNIAAIRTNR